MAYQNGRRARGALLSMTTLLALAAVPAHAADQFKQAADGAGIECSVSARELTRFALIDDQFASVSKISTGTPYNDFAVTNEPLRGDIYISVPETYAAGSISFFATTKKGYVYKVSCRVEQIPAAQVFNLGRRIRIPGTQVPERGIHGLGDQPTQRLLTHRATPTPPSPARRCWVCPSPWPCGGSASRSRRESR